MEHIDEGDNIIPAQIPDNAEDQGRFDEADKMQFKIEVIHEYYHDGKSHENTEDGGTCLGGEVLRNLEESKRAIDGDDVGPDDLGKRNIEIGGGVTINHNNGYRTVYTRIK